MKKRTFHQIGLMVILSLVTLSSCKKESESTFTIFDGLKLDFKETLGSDEVYLEFTLSKTASGAGMKRLVVTETGNTAPVYTTTIPFAQRYSYSSGVLVLNTSSPSTASYIIKVFDETDNDITSSVTIAYPAGKQVVSEARLITDKEVQNLPEGSTVYVDYTVTSEDKNIKFIWLESFATGSAEPSRINIATVPDEAPEKKFFRGAVRLNIDRNGGSKFRLYVTDEANDYIGDGYTSIHTNVIAGFELSANKFIYAPRFEATVDDPDVSSKSFYSILKKQTFNYSQGKENSADIDFGIYLTASGNSSFPYNLNFYSLNVTTNPLVGKYDFSDWTKRMIRFGPATTEVAQPNNSPSIPAAQVFSNMSSGASINSIITQGRYANALTRTSLTRISVGSIVFFRTQEGKYGAIFVNGFGKDFQGRYYANIDVKVEK